MPLTPSDVRRLAGLARIDLAEDEAALLAGQLSEILGRLDDLQAPDDDAAAAPPTADAPLRADEPGVDAMAFGPSDLAPAWVDGLFTVPRLASHEEERAPEEEA